MLLPARSPAIGTRADSANTREEHSAQKITVLAGHVRSWPTIQGSGHWTTLIGQHAHTINMKTDASLSKQQVTSQYCDARGRQDGSLP